MAMDPVAEPHNKPDPPLRSVEEQHRQPVSGSAPGTPDVQIERTQGLVRLTAIAALVLASFATLAGLYYAQLPIVVLLVSIMLAYVLAPVTELFERGRVPRPVASAFAVLVFLGVLYGIGHFSYNKAADFAKELPRYSAEARHLVRGFRQRAQELENSTENVLPKEQAEKGAVRAEQSSGLRDALFENLGTVTEVFLAATFIPFLVYFMLSWQDHVRAATVMLFRMEHRNTAYVTLGLISSMLRQFMVGNVIIGLFIGAISTVIFGILHVPYFYFIGFISGFLSIVPYLGVLLAAVPPVIAGIGHLHSTEFLMVAATVVFAHLFGLNVLYPKILGRRVQLNPLSVTMALLFWGWMWGGMGLILAIPVTAAMKIVFDHIDGLRGYGAWLGE